jgi:hypothetical protein
VPLIEIDYLHESPSVVSRLPHYPTHPRSYPYSILVTDPRPVWNQGSLRAYGFGVGEILRMFPLPLAGDEMLFFDLNPVYARTFLGGRWGTFFDYTDEPERMHTYRADDQAAIRAVMAIV